MGRRPKEDRDDLKTVVVGVKLSEAERDLLDRLAESRAAELEDLTGERLPVSAGAVVRWLVVKEAKARGILTPGSLPAPPRPEPSPPSSEPPRARTATKTSTSKASPTKGEPSKGRGSK